MKFKCDERFAVFNRLEDFKTRHNHVVSRERSFRHTSHYGAFMGAGDAVVSLR